MMQYAVDEGDGHIVADPTWSCIADVVGSYHGGFAVDGRVTGTLLCRASEADEWEPYAMTDTLAVGGRVRVIDQMFDDAAFGTIVNDDAALPHRYEVQLDRLSVGNTFWFAANELEAKPPDSADEVADILRRFMEELAKATGDGSRKRQAGTKPAWWEDDSHEGAMFSHLTKWKRGELVDPDSGAHPLVHLAWRALAIACKETGNVPIN